jgi:hypothetical protein
MNPDSSPSDHRPLWLEFVVPAIMLAACAISLWDSLQLSVMAMVLPLALIVVTLVPVIWAVITAIRQGGPSETELADEEPGAGPVFSPRPWLLVLLPLALLIGFDWFGALASLVALVFIAQFMLGARHLLLALGVAVFTAVPIYLLFKHVLYVRFPAGLFGIG